MKDSVRSSLPGLLAAVFFGAFNDNAWRMVVVLLAFQRIETQLMDASALDVQSAYQDITALTMLVFMLPLILFSLPAGTVADRVSKRSVIVATKAAEVFLMAGALVVLALAPMSTWAPLVIVSLMGVQSAIFSPAKFGILPEMLPHERLSHGNGLVQLWTFVAIVSGVGIAGPLVGWSGGSLWWIGVILLASSLLGFVGSLGVPRVPVARAGGAVVETVLTAGRFILRDRVLLFTVVGLVLFWMVGSLTLQNVLVYARAGLGLSDTVATLPSAVLSIGIGAGSVLAIRLSGVRVEYGLIPLGAIGLGAFVLAQGAVGPGPAGTFVVVAAAGVAGGLVIVPLESLLQWQAPPDRRGGIIALSNVFVSLGTLGGAMLVAGLGAYMAPRGIFVVGGLLALAGTAWALWLLPAAFLRLVAIILTRIVYRIDVRGAANVPEEGEALLVPNHVSLIDAFFLVASTDREIHFVVSERVFGRAGLRQVARIMKWIPISSDGGPRAIIGAMNEAATYLDQGKVVCIFPEGEITRTGMMLPFRQGFERMVKGRETPIIPVHLGQVWGSIFSRAGGRFVWKIPKKVPYPVTVSFGHPLPATASVFDVRQAIRELGADAWMARKGDRLPLQRSFIRSVRRRPRALAFADEQRPKVSRFGALTGSIALARRMRAIWGDDRCVGIMLPPSVPAALLNLAATLSGRTVVNLNYTAGQAGLDSAARQAGLSSVVTSARFLEKAGVELSGELTPIWIEDVAGGITGAGRLTAALIALFAPARLIERLCGAVRPTRMDDAVAIIFSSGSTGEPKGVVLSHFNIDANVEGSAQALQVLPDDRILGVLPLFHSFGYMVTLWFAANHGMGVVYHPNPLDAPAHGELIRRYRVTLLASTPTFLQIYMKRTQPGQLGSLRMVLAGAEKLSEHVASAFEQTFGLKPFQGYGATECAPIIAVSLPDHRMPGFFQPGSRDGFVGRALPGIVVRAVDPEKLDETIEPLGPNEPGMLLVRGPNVMQGYLGRDDLTSKALREGWYVTGDIGLIDEDGYIRITDRLSRFSKIGGEMVPHGRVEEALHLTVESEEQVFAVTALPDERKGERLVVLHKVDEGAVGEIVESLKQSGLPNLFIPRPENFVRVAEFPLLGTGKIDLRGLRRIAEERAGD